MAAALLLAVLPLAGPAAAQTVNMQLAPSSSGQAGAAIGSRLGTSGAGAARSTGLSNAYRSIGAAATPGQGPAQGSTVSATASRTTAFALDCARSSAPPPDFGLLAYPLGIETACIKTGTGQYVVDLCPATESGGACSTAQDWVQQAITPNGTFQAGAKIRLAVGACPNDRCAVTLTQTGAFQGTGAGFKQQGYRAIASGLQRPGVTQSAIGMGVYTASGQAILPGSNANSGAYLGNLLANGSAVTACIRKQKTALQGGRPVYTCSGSSSVDFGGQNCPNTTTCVKWQTGTVHWTEQCVVSVSQGRSTCTSTTPVSSTACTTTTPVEQCTLSNQAVTEQCAIDYTPTVVAKSSCTPNTWVYAAPIYEQVWDYNTGNYVTASWTGSAYYRCDPSSKGQVAFKFVSITGKDLYITVPTTYYPSAAMYEYAGSCSGWPYCLPPLYQSGFSGWWPSHSYAPFFYNWFLTGSSPYDLVVNAPYMGCDASGHCAFVFSSFAGILADDLYARILFDLPHTVYSLGATARTDGCTLYGG